MALIRDGNLKEHRLLVCVSLVTGGSGRENQGIKGKVILCGYRDGMATITDCNPERLVINVPKADRGDNDERVWVKVLR